VRIADEPETALSGVGDQRSANQVAGELGTAAVSWRPGAGDLETTTLNSSALLS